MTQSDLTVADGVVVSLDYELQLENGELIDSSAEGQPLQYLHGQHQIISGLENALYGMAVGGEQQVEVSPAEGYGEHKPEQVQNIPNSVFPEGMKFTKGDRLQLRDSQSGQVFETEVVDVLPTSVVLDFNHPLAGKTLYFQVRIAGLREATAEELAHGHVHDGNGHESDGHDGDAH